MLKTKLDHHVAARPTKAALDAWLAAQRDAEAFMEYAKKEQRVLDLLGDDGTSALHMCASGAEAIQSALFSHYFHTVRQTGNNHVLFSEGLPVQRMEEWGCAIKPLAVNA